MFKESKTGALMWVFFAVAFGTLLLAFTNEQEKLRVMNERLAVDRELAHARMCYMYRTVWRTWEYIPTLALYSFPSPDLEKWCARP